MNLVLRRDLLDRPVAPQRFQCHLGLEVRREPASCRHLVSLRQSVEYTLATCPIFWDQLSDDASDTLDRAGFEVGMMGYEEVSLGAISGRAQPCRWNPREEPWMYD